MENDQELTGVDGAAAEQAGDHKSVPLAALEDERGKRQALEDKVRNLEENIALFRANLPSAESKREVEQAKEPDLLEGMDEGDVLTIGEMKKILQKQSESFKKEKDQFAQNIGGSISEIQTILWNPDYKEIVSKHLPNVLKIKPHLGDVIRTSKNPSALAYELAKLDPEYQKSKKSEEIDEKAQRIIDNLGKPQLSGAKGGGALDIVSRFSNLTDDQLEEEIAKVKNK
jgi:hypothetical protein